MDDLVNFYKDGNKLPNTLSGSLELIDLLYSRIKQLENDLSGYKKGVDLLKIEDTQHIEKIGQQEDILEEIGNWCKAYPIKIFPEPDMKKAHEILKEHGMTLDAISASNMRHVLNGISEILQKSSEG